MQLFDTIFFIVSKIAWAMIRPETVFVLMLLAAGLLWSLDHSGGAMAVLTVALAGVFLVAMFPVGDVLLAPLERQFPAHPDVKDVSTIIVLGGAKTPKRMHAWDPSQLVKAGERYMAGITLGKRFPDALLIFAGGSGALFPGKIREADVAQMTFLQAGIASERLWIEGTSRNTAENACNALGRLEPSNSGATLLVTSAWHMPRALSTFYAAGWQRLVPWPVDFRSGAIKGHLGWNLAGNLEDLNIGVREWIGLLAYRLTGRIAPDQGRYTGTEP